MNFRLWVMRASGAPSFFEIGAASRRDAEDAARAAGYVVLGETNRSSGDSRTRLRSSRFNVQLFTEEIVALLAAGLNLIEGLRALADKANGRDRQVIDRLCASLAGGSRFSDALQQSNQFPDLYIHLVRASEQTSDLETALERYLVHSTQMDQIRQKIISAAIYPCILIATGAAAMLFLLLFVVPRFSGIYEDMRGNLPWAATLMLHWSRLIKGHNTEVGIGVAMLVGLLVVLYQSTEVRRAVSKAIHNLPLFGEELRLFYIARLYRTIGMLLEGGIALLSAVQMSAAVLPADFRLQTDRVIARLREGVKPSVVFREQGLSSAIADQMLTVGEQSGNLGLMMTRIAHFYEVDVARKLERAMRIFEPVLMALIGIGIGLVVILMYLPIFELAGSIQ